MKQQQAGRKAQPLQFGDMVYVPFPFSDCDAEKNRWAFVLADKGENVVVAYATTNPAIRSSVCLGDLGDRKVSHLVAFRWECISKERILPRDKRRPARWDMAIIGAVGMVASKGGYDGYSEEILATAKQKREALLKRQQQK